MNSRRVSFVALASTAAIAAMPALAQTGQAGSAITVATIHPMPEGADVSSLEVKPLAAVTLPMAGNWNLASLAPDSAPEPALSPALPDAGSTAEEGTDDAYRIAPPANELYPPQRWADHVPSEYATHPGFWKQAGTVKTESLLFLGYFAFQGGTKLFKETQSFHFKDEGWFGKNTSNVGVDKMAHAFNTYLLAEILHMRLHKTTNASEGDALTAAILASGLAAFNELSDAIEPDSGFSMQDIAMNLAGAGFSVLRNTVPGLKEKVAFKIEIVPNGDFYSYRGKSHYQQERFMFSIKGAGFEKLADTPLRFVDLQVGYYASDFLKKDREAGIEPKRHLFVGLGLNLGELLFGRSRSGLGKVGYDVLDYLQIPYTSIRYDTTGRFGH